ncbi:MAG TPA: hypothetical protein VGL10_00080 [Gammaproteobacteria bacterium]
MIGKMRYVLISGLFVVSSAALANQDWKDKDENHDGRVTRAEFMSAAEEKFAKMDTDSNGAISEDEMKAHKEDMKGKRKDRSQDS